MVEPYCICKNEDHPQWVAYVDPGRDLWVRITKDGWTVNEYHHAEKAGGENAYILSGDWKRLTVAEGIEVMPTVYDYLNNITPDTPRTEADHW